MRLFDLHCDTVYECVKTGASLLQNDRQVDLTRGKAFYPWYQCFALWVQDGLSPREARMRMAAMLHRAQIFSQRYPQDFRILHDWQTASETPPTACTAVLTVENGGVAAGGDALPAQWMACGVKAVSLTWNGSNRWAEGCEGDPHCGLTAAGKAAVKEMLRHDILPDLAHLNRRGFYEIADMTAAPLLVTHTAAAALQPGERNLDDAQFDLLRDSGGLLGLDFCEAHLGTQTLDCFIAHLEHFLARGGERHVALGSDFDGMDLPPVWQGMRVLESLYTRLLQRNYAESLIDDFFFGNAYRFFTNRFQQKG